MFCVITKNIDLFIIGGGINGTGIAADAALRGLSVMLCESHDLASGTSSASTKLIHGGLRYLEYFEFGLVRKALQEREILLSIAPHIIRPLEFILPHNTHLRPAFILQIGLFLYDHLARRKNLPASKKMYFQNDANNPLKPIFKMGFSYADCWVDDARLVVLNARAAFEKGAVILVRTACIKAIRKNGLWHITLKNRDTGLENTVCAKALVNAAGPWVGQVIDQVIHTQAKHNVKMIKGSHIVVPALYEGEQAYILQNKDGRIIFAIPYQQHFTLIGTTDLAYEGDPRDVKISVDEKKYLCQMINASFKKTITEDDIVWDYSGVRPLYDDHEKNPSKVTRDYRFEIEAIQGAAPLLSIFGGKITTYRCLAEKALLALKPYFPNMKDSLTATTPLPGGDLGMPISDYLNAFMQQYPWAPKAMAARLVSSYGSYAHIIVKDATSLLDLGENLGADLFEREVKYLIDHEWARSAEDILWRRSKLGLYINKDLTKLQSVIRKLLQK